MVENTLAEALSALKSTLRSFRSGLTWRVAAPVLIAIVAVEAVILVTSHIDQKRRILAEHAGEARHLVRFDFSDPTTDESGLLAQASNLTAASGVAGVTVVLKDGRSLTVGEASDPLTVPADAVEGFVGRYARGRLRYDVAVSVLRPGPVKAVVIRFDMSQIPDDLAAFAWRVAGLVAIVTAFVAFTTLLAMGGYVLRPILGLRNQLLEGGGNTRIRLDAKGLARRDELGDLYRAVNEMLERIAESSAAVSAAARFPEENPNPVLRCTDDGTVIYANPPAAALNCFVTEDGKRIAAALAQPVRQALESGQTQKVDISCDGYNFSALVAPIGNLGYANIYGSDTTLLKQAETRLAILNRELESRVEERTRELSAVNRSLENEIAQRQRAEEALTAKSALLEVVIDSIPCSVSAVDRDLKLLTCNDLYYEMLDLPRDRFGPGSRLEDVIRYIAARGEYGSSDIESVVRERLEAARGVTGRFDRTRPDGTVLEVRNNGLTGGGSVTIHTDVTDREHREAELRRTREQALSASRSKSEFLANMSHELRTPLNAVLGFSETIRDELFGPVGNRKYLEYAADIHASGSHLLAIINDILDLSKVEAGEAELTESEMDVALVFEDCLRLVKDRAVEAGIALERNLPDSLPRLRADERKFKQIIINLLSNSLKFTPGGGRVRVDASVGGEGEFILAVHDTGVGIPEEDLARALAPFSQVDGSLSRTHEGTGLGLPLAKSLTELHGGRLELQSEVGHGTTVTLRFPAGRVIPRTPNGNGNGNG